MNTQELSQPPPMVRMASGQLVRAQSVSKAAPHRRFLVVCQYYEGDKAEFEELCHLIADMERVKNRDADILLFARADATEPSRDVRSKLETKFERVLFERSRRKDARGHPWGANAMFYDLVTLFGQVQQWAELYYAFIPLETDCVPTRPGWINELALAWKRAEIDGKSCIGFIHDDPIRHMNGVGVYAIDIWARVGSNKLAGGNPQIAYDIRHASSILPLAADSPLFHFEFRRPTITAEELFKKRKDGICPAIWHGVKDGSARDAVRAKYVNFTDQREFSRQTVFTYYEPSDHTSQTESAALLEVWRDGWKSRGWNPVILSSRDAVKHPRFAEILERVKRMPMGGHAAAHINRFMRWVALARMGGGLMVDYDLIPGDFTPHDLPAGMLAITDQQSGQLCGLKISKDEAVTWINAIETYEPHDPDDCGITDLMVFRGTLELAKAEITKAGIFGRNDWQTAKLIHFSQSAVNQHKPGMRKSVAIDSYLRAKI